MNEYVPMQSLIDHIKAAVDVDPWAKEAAEELLGKQIPVKPSKVRAKPGDSVYYYCYCGRCQNPVGTIEKGHKLTNKDYCEHCGQKVCWEGAMTRDFIIVNKDKTQEK